MRACCMTDALLTARSLACRRGDRLLWTGLDLTLLPGGAIHVTGANGTGKSSLLRMLAGLLPIAAGTVDRSGPIGLLDEQPAIDADLPLRRALSWWAQVDATDRADVDRAIDDVGLSAITDVPMRLFSTGQRKRAALARLLVQNAPVWLLDEPLNGLDSDGTERLLALIDQHRVAGGAVILASHQPLLLAGGATISLADHVA